MKREFKVDDRVRIRQWDDMVKEFGLSSAGTIICRYGFPSGMRHLCGRAATINKINNETISLVDWDDSSGDTFWSFSEGMLEYVDQPVKLTLEFDPNDKKASHVSLSKMIDEYNEEMKRKSREWTDEEINEAVRLIRELSIEFYDKYDTFPIFFHKGRTNTVSANGDFGTRRNHNEIYNQGRLMVYCSEDDIFSVDIGRCVALHKLLGKPVPAFIMNKGKKR